MYGLLGQSDSDLNLLQTMKQIYSYTMLNYVYIIRVHIYSTTLLQGQQSMQGECECSSRLQILTTDHAMLRSAATIDDTRNNTTK